MLAFLKRIFAAGEPRLAPPKGLERSNPLREAYASTFGFEYESDWPGPARTWWAAPAPFYVILENDQLAPLTARMTAAGFVSEPFAGYQDDDQETAMLMFDKRNASFGGFLALIREFSSEVEADEMHVAIQNSAWEVYKEPTEGPHPGALFSVKKEGWRYESP